MRDVKVRKCLEFAEGLCQNKDESCRPLHVLMALTLDKNNIAYNLIKECGFSGSIDIKYSGEPKRPENLSTFIVRLDSRIREINDDYIVNTSHLLKEIIRDKECREVLAKKNCDVDKLFTRLSSTTISRESIPTPFLDNFSRDLTEEASKGDLDPVVDRENETELLCEVLSRRNKSNAILVGDPGVGKSSIAEGLASRIYENRVPEQLKSKRLLSLEVASLIAGTKFRGDFESRIKSIINEAIGAGNVILFIDEIHSIIGAGDAARGTDAANILKPYLSKGTVQVVGATTYEEAREIFEKDKALRRRFQKIRIDEPSKEETFAILRGIRSRYEKFHGLNISDKVLNSVVNLAGRYVFSSFNPDKAIDLMDQSCGMKKSRKNLTKEEKTVSNRINEVRESIRQYMENKNIVLAAEKYDNMLNLKKKLNIIRAQKEVYSKKKDLSVEDVAATVSRLTNIPVSEIAKKEIEKLSDLPKRLRTQVIGQDNPIDLLCNSIRRSRLGLSNEQKPLGSFLFMGTTGVGKSYLAKKLAEALFGTEKQLKKFDMSEYSDKHTVSKLIGSPPGFVGYESGGELVNIIREYPYSVLLFDEVEKAHPDVYDILLQVMEDGTLKDKTGKVANFSNCVIIMTSNIGSKVTYKKAFGFTDKNGVSDDGMEQNMKMKAKDYFKPEFLNRIDNIVVFNRLSEDNLRNILDIKLDELKAKISELFECDITFSKSCKSEIIKEVVKDENYNARPLDRIITKNIVDTFSDYVVKNGNNLNNYLTVKYLKKKYIISPKKHEKTNKKGEKNV